MLPPAPESILIVKPSSLGDVVHTLPCAAILRRAWPGAALRWIVNEEWAPLLAGNSDLDEVIHFPRQQFRGPGALCRVLPWAHRIRERVRADLVLDFQGLLRSALLAQLCCTKRGRIVGMTDAREGARHFYREVVDVAGRVHAVDRYLGLLAGLGLDTPGSLEWQLPVGEPVAGVPEGFVLLHPFSRGSGKSLTSEQVRAFCEGCAPVPVVIAGRVTGEPGPFPGATVLLNLTTLPELIWLLRAARWVVSVDSGPMHIAAAVSANLVSMHTWSDPRKVGPYRRDAWVWQDGVLRQARAEVALETVGELGGWVRDRVLG